MTTDGDRIAPVTWLFGQPEPPAPEPPRSPSVAFVADSQSVDSRRIDDGSLNHGVDEDGVDDDSVDDGGADLDRAGRRGTRADGRFDRINNVSMNALARRGISAAEMVELLLRREFDRDEVEAECDRLLGVGLLDDHALAETLVRTLTQRKGLGRSALTAELRRRKLDPSAIETALAALDGDDELVRATELAERRAPQLRSLDAETARRRLGAFLMRKGYSGTVVSAAVARALAPSGGPVFR